MYLELTLFPAVMSVSSFADSFPTGGRESRPAAFYRDTAYWVGRRGSQLRRAYQQPHPLLCPKVSAGCVVVSLMPFFEGIISWVTLLRELPCVGLCSRGRKIISLI